MTRRLLNFRSVVLRDFPPDKQGRLTYMDRWDTLDPVHCSRCGGRVDILYKFGARILVCTGYPYATPPRLGCGKSGLTMPRGQIMKRLPDTEAAR